MKDMNMVQRGGFLTLGTTTISNYGEWLQSLRKTVQMDEDLFWAAVGVDRQQGKSYEEQKLPPPATVMTAVVYVHIMMMPMVFINSPESDFRLESRLISAFFKSRETVPIEVRWKFLGK